MNYKLSLAKLAGPHFPNEGVGLFTGNGIQDLKPFSPAIALKPFHSMEL
jgi:hypothetical protein